MNRHQEDDTGRGKKKSRKRHEGEKWHQQLSPANWISAKTKCLHFPKDKSDSGGGEIKIQRWRIKEEKQEEGFGVCFTEMMHYRGQSCRTGTELCVRLSPSAAVCNRCTLTAVPYIAFRAATMIYSLTASLPSRFISTSLLHLTALALF